MKDNQSVLLEENIFATLAVDEHPEVIRWQLRPILDNVLKDLPTHGVFERGVPRILCRFLVFKEIYEERHPTLTSIRRDLTAGPDHIRSLLDEAASQDLCSSYESLGCFLKRLINSQPQNFARSHIATEAALEKFAQREAG